MIRLLFGVVDCKRGRLLLTRRRRSLHRAKGLIPADGIGPKNLLTGEYTYIFNHTGKPVHPYGFRCRMTESNDYPGGIAGASNAMASIPKAQAIRAFDIVDGGWTLPVEISNSGQMNLTAYAMKNNNYLYLTIINKEYGKTAHQAKVTINAKGFAKGKAEAMYSIAIGNNVGAISGITLGGDSIINNRPWQGQWSSVETGKEGVYSMNVAESSAVVVKIPVID